MTKNTDRHGRTRTYTDDTTVRSKDVIDWGIVRVYLALAVAAVAVWFLAVWKVIDLIRWAL